MAKRVISRITDSVKTSVRAAMWERMRGRLQGAVRKCSHRSTGTEAADLRHEEDSDRTCQPDRGTDPERRMDSNSIRQRSRDDHPKGRQRERAESVVGTDTRQRLGRDVLVESGVPVNAEDFPGNSTDESGHRDGP